MWLNNADTETLVWQLIMAGGGSVFFGGAYFGTAYGMAAATIDYYNKGCGVIFRIIYPMEFNGTWTQCHYLGSCTVFD
ncbi:hypothetical protein [Candidatus Contubernalis alkaliaceticus]|uniref:hypothetical protein n=1 Tax=Candidatus Contubernalis alkaliaceticus TaxID=338645 RepID=UPI001F4C412D|nr:hypothetical protein [Candidatus Contubernalis alkalaceticus]UNC93265.1 hypothetical protein HUE98_14915 [Candidatus Contubernalis alkalaceticus]